MLDLILIGLALRFFVFDYTYSPIQKYLQTATNPILVALTHCTFCQGSEIAFILQAVDLYYGANIVSVFLKAIAVGYVSMIVGIWLSSLNSNDDFNFAGDFDGQGIIVED